MWGCLIDARKKRDVFSHNCDKLYKTNNDAFGEYITTVDSTDVIQLTLTLKMILPKRLSKHHSLSTTTVLFRTMFTWTIMLNLSMYLVIDS